MAEVTEIVCVNPRCGKPITLMKPTCEVIAGNYVTVMVFMHQGESQRCAKCGQGYVPVLKDVSGINFVWKAVQHNIDPVVLRREEVAKPPYPISGPTTT